MKDKAPLKLPVVKKIKVTIGEITKLKGPIIVSNDTVEYNKKLH